MDVLELVVRGAFMLGVVVWGFLTGFYLYAGFRYWLPEAERALGEKRFTVYAVLFNLSHIIGLAWFVATIPLAAVFVGPFAFGYFLSIPMTGSNVEMDRRLRE